MPQVDRIPTREDALALIRHMATMNPDDDPHGLIDRSFTALCEQYDPERVTATPLTLEEWKTLRGAEDYDAALGRNILDATDPFVFLFILRDRLVFNGGCVDMVIMVLSLMLDRMIDPVHVTWREGVA